MSLPVTLQPSIGRALVVGGGAVAARKVKALRAGGFEVTVVAPEIMRGLAGPGIEIIERRFQADDLHDHALVLACTDDRDVNRRVGILARATRIPVLVADAPGESTFHLPAVHRDGDLAVAISTGGASPALAAEIRDRVAGSLGNGWAGRLEAAREARQERRAAAQQEGARQ